MKLKKLRNALLVVLTLALVSATAVAITWALVKDQLDTKENIFTSPEVAASLAEDRWDSLDFDSEDDIPAKDTEDITLPYSKDSEGHSTTVDADELGYYLAKSYSESAVIPKNPGIKNTSEDSTLREWVAMKVDYRMNLGNTSDGYNSYSSVANVFVGQKTVSGVTYYLKQNGDATAEVTDTENWTKNSSEAWKVTAYKQNSLAGVTTTTESNKYYFTFASRSNFENALALLKSDVAGTNAASYSATSTFSANEDRDADGTDDDESSGRWLKKDESETVFYYTKQLSVASSGETEDVNITKPLFKSVKIKDSFGTPVSAPLITYDQSNNIVRDNNGMIDMTEHQFYTIRMDGSSGSTDVIVEGLPEFDIKLQGFAVQGNGVAFTDGKAALDDLISYTTTSTN